MSIIFLGEGVTEKKFIHALSILGRFQSFNVSQNPIRKLLPKLSKGSRIYIIYDTDILNEENFKENIKILSQQKHLHFAGLIQQTENLEEEIISASKLNKQQVLSQFNCSAISELKKQLTQTTNLAKKLNDIELDCHKLWQQPCPKSISYLQTKRVHYADLEKRNSN